MGDISGVVTRVLGHTILPDIAADRSGYCSIFVEITYLATKKSSRYGGLVARLAISSITYKSLAPKILSARTMKLDHSPSYHWDNVELGFSYQVYQNLTIRHCKGEIK